MKDLFIQDIKKYFPNIKVVIEVESPNVVMVKGDNFKGLVCPLKDVNQFLIPSEKKSLEKLLKVKEWDLNDLTFDFWMAGRKRWDYSPFYDSDNTNWNWWLTGDSKYICGTIKEN